MSLEHLDGDIVYQDELQRKTLETMQWLLTEYERGAIARSHYAVALKSLDMATRGLIDDEISQAIDLEVLGRSQDIIEFRVFKVAASNRLILSRHNRTQGSNQVIRGRFIGEGMVHTNAESDDSIAAADEAIQKLAGKVMDELGGHEL